MRTALIAVIVILCVFTALALVSALWVQVLREAGVRRRQVDPFSHPFGDMPRLSDQQMRETMQRIARDPLRRSFATRDLNSRGELPSERDADGVGGASPRVHAVRTFFTMLLMGRRHAA